MVVAGEVPRQRKKATVHTVLLLHLILLLLQRAVELKRADLVKTNRINLKSIMIEVEVVNNETLSRFPFATNPSFTTTSWKQNNQTNLQDEELHSYHQKWFTVKTQDTQIFIKVLYSPPGGKR